jgi:hypothetical protein
MLERARELARHGHRAQMIEGVLIANGFPEASEWIDQPHISRELKTLADEARNAGRSAAQDGDNQDREQNVRTASVCEGGSGLPFSPLIRMGVGQRISPYFTTAWLASRSYHFPPTEPLISSHFRSFARRLKPNISVHRRAALGSKASACLRIGHHLINPYHCSSTACSADCQPSRIVANRQSPARAVPSRTRTDGVSAARAVRSGSRPPLLCRQPLRVSRDVRYF